MQKHKRQTVESLRSNPPKLLNVPEASLYIGISQRYLRNLIAERKIPVVRIGARVVLRLKDIDSWVDQLAQQ